MTTTYNTVIVTRNRPEALALSLPLHLAQNRPPKAIFVIDSSDDPSENKALVTRLTSESSIRIEHIISPSGMTVQRNVGLKYVDADVVFFPDDDSLVPPEAMTAIMRIYDLDQDRVIGGVCSAEAFSPPSGVFKDVSGIVYEKKYSDSFRLWIASLRTKFEKKFFIDPFHLTAQRLYEDIATLPHWLFQENAVSVNWMTGFRMSFRSEIIKEIGFEEGLGRYALFEDVVASFAVLKSHLLIGARNASIYHHKAPARRANGRALGAMQILNRAYAIARSGVLNDTANPLRIKEIRRAERRFAAYKCAQYMLGFYASFGRERFIGAFKAMQLTPRLLHANGAEYNMIYQELRDHLFEQEE